MESEETTITVECTLKAGDRIDSHYVIERWLGGGGFSCVYLARDQNLDDMYVVIKVLKSGGTQAATILKKFRQESEALSRIRHDGVVKVLGRGHLPDERPYLVLEYVEGETLRHLMSAGRLDFETVSALVRQLGSALGAAHEKNIYHRDLKPENILVHRRTDGGLVVKLIDFGIARVTDSLVTQDAGTAKFWGTPRYMSPEQLMGADPTAASDVYSLGVIVYEVLTGSRPYGDTPSEFALLRHGGVPARPTELRPELPPEAEKVILKALEQNPHCRYQSACELGDKLADALIETGKKNRAGRVMRLLIPLAVLSLVTTLVVWWVASDFKPRQIDNAEASAAMAHRDLRYYLTVQKMRGGQPYQEPFRASGQEIFENDYLFTFHLQSPETGYFYLYSEGAADDGTLHFNILYPTPKRNNGSAQVGSVQEVSSGENSFGGRADTEKLWVVWTKEQLPQLEAAKAAAFAGNGRIKDNEQEQNLRAFLHEHSANRQQTVKDVSSKETVIKGVGDVIVSVQYLEHR